MSGEYFGYTTGSNTRLNDSRQMAARMGEDVSHYPPPQSDGAYIPPTVDWDSPDFPDVEASNAAYSNDTIELIKKRIMGQNSGAVRDLGSQWFRVMQVIEDLSGRVRKAGNGLRYGGDGSSGNNSGWSGPGADAFLARGPGATLKSLDDWYDAARANWLGSHFLASAISEHQSEMSSVWADYQSDMVTASDEWWEREGGSYYFDGMPHNLTTLAQAPPSVKDDYVSHLRVRANEWNREAQRVQYRMAQSYWSIMTEDLAGGFSTRYEGPVDAVAHDPAFIRRHLMGDAGIPPGVTPPTMPTADAPAVGPPPALPAGVPGPPAIMMSTFAGGPGGQEAQANQLQQQLGQLDQSGLNDATDALAGQQLPGAQPGVGPVLPAGMGPATLGLTGGGPGLQGLTGRTGGANLPGAAPGTFPGGLAGIHGQSATTASTFTTTDPSSAQALPGAPPPPAAAPPAFRGPGAVPMIPGGGRGAGQPGQPARPDAPTAAGPAGTEALGTPPLMPGAPVLRAPHAGATGGGGPDRRDQTGARVADGAPPADAPAPPVGTAAPPVLHGPRPPEPGRETAAPRPTGPATGSDLVADPTTGATPPVVGRPAGVPIDTRPTGPMVRSPGGPGDRSEAGPARERRHQRPGTVPERHRRPDAARVAAEFPGIQKLLESGARPAEPAGADVAAPTPSRPVPAREPKPALGM